MSKNPVVQDVETAVEDVTSGKGVSPVVQAVIRTSTPALVGAAVTFAATHGLHLSPVVEAEVETGGTWIIGTAYYYLVTKLETRWPRLGWFLGKPGKPSYQA